MLGATVSNSYFLLYSYNFIYYLFLAGLGRQCHVGFSLAVASRAWSLVAGLGCSGLLVAVASLFGEHGFWGMQPSLVAAFGLSGSKACGIFPDKNQTQVSYIGKQILYH